MSEVYDHHGKTADAIVVGGGAVGLHTANALYDAMGKNARILAVTQESEWGGLAGRSLEQYRLFNDSYAMAEIVGRGVELYGRVDEELRGRQSTERAYEQFPYIFTVGDRDRPEHVAELLPNGTPDRPDMEYYRKLKNDTVSWGFDPRAVEMSADELRGEFPLLDGGGIRSAMVINNAGRLHFDVMRNWLMERSRADGDGRGVTYRTRTTLQNVLLNDSGKAVGVELNGEKIYTDKIILAIGAFAVRLPQLLRNEETERLAANFTVTQRELFFANLPGVRNTNFFLISPDMAIARVSTHEGHASYGYAAADDRVVTVPEIDPHPNLDFDKNLQMDRKSVFIGRTYTMLGECSLRWNPDIHSGQNLALAPFGRHSAGYYVAYRDDLPVVGTIADTGVVLAAGSHHSGVMGGQGIAELAVDHALGLQTISKTTHEQTDINRTPVEHTGLVL